MDGAIVEATKRTFREEISDDRTHGLLGKVVRGLAESPDDEIDVLCGWLEDRYDPAAANEGDEIATIVMMAVVLMSEALRVRKGTKSA